jgi:hypothetical protein
MDPRTSPAPSCRRFSPVVSVVSSGDDNARKEFIQVEQMITPESHRMRDGVAVLENGAAVVDPRARKPFFAWAAFGLVSVRTDGERLLVSTNSGTTDLKEAYAFVMDDSGKPVPVPVQAV